ncbi:MAG: glycosyltransferase family 2 protein [Bacteroidales bacterium]|nr:glycosyltransferase family 2 protein [Bacteroidales bacterium]
MTYLAYFILSFAGLQFLVSLINLFWGKFTFTAPKSPGLPVSVMIPARNEEKNIGNLLNDLIHQDYKNIEILVFDDQSTDATAGIVRGYSAKDGRVRLIQSDGLPEGWLGKNHACHSLSKEAKGDYFLFLDADVRIGNSIIENTVSFSEKYKTGLLSLFPKQIMHTPAEWSTVPVMNHILLSLLPLVLVRKSKFRSLAAANGQFMLFNPAVYKKFSPHQVFKTDAVEDIKTARYLKQNRIKIACHTGPGAIKCRMYDEYDEAVSGFSKNVTSFFGGSFLLALIFWIVTSFGFVAVLIGLPAAFFVVFLFLVVVTRVFVSITSEQNILKNLVFLLPQQVAMGKFIFRAMANKTKNNFTWKGRNIS